MNNAMPMADNLIKRRITNINPACSFCNNHTETLSHLFRDCEFSQRIWSASLGIVATQGDHLSIQDWIRNFLNLFRKKKQKEERKIESDFISTLWGIWIHRNEIIFNKAKKNPSRILDIISDSNRRLHRINNKQSEFREHVKGDAKTISSKPMEWSSGTKSTTTMQILEVDGAWKNRKGDQWRAAIAWKNKNEDQGEESAARIFANSPVQTEAYAVLKALQDMEWKCSDITIRTDNLEVVQALKNRGRTNKNIDPIIADIKRIARSFHFVSCIKVGREGVKLAHNLATKARKGEI